MSDASRDVAVATALAALVAVVAWFVGVSGAQALLLAAAVMTIAAGVTFLPPREVSWPERRSTTVDGARSEVATLSWTLIGRRGTVTDRATRRLVALAEHRLAQHGLSLRDPRNAEAAERLIGSRGYHVLRAAAADPSRPMRYGSFVRGVTAVERLNDAAAAASWERRR